MGRLRELWSLPPTDRRLVLSAAVLLWTSRLALLVARPAVVRWIVHRIAPWLPPSRSVPDPDRVARAVRAAGRGLPLAPACLGSAIVGHAMLDAHGHPSEVRIGVTKDGPDELEAHAWVERDGHVLVGDLPDLARYRPLAADGGDGEPERPGGW